MNDLTCSVCIYFCQHYIPWYNDAFIPVEYGHCIYARTKIRRPAQAACEHFLPRNTPL